MSCRSQLLKPFGRQLLLEVVPYMLVGGIPASRFGEGEVEHLRLGCRSDAHHDGHRFAGVLGEVCAQP